MDAPFAACAEAMARHVPFRTREQTRSFAGLVVTAIEGAYVRCRAEGSAAAFVEASAWLAKLAPRGRG